jgi:hypothetical protein
MEGQAQTQLFRLPAAGFESGDGLAAAGQVLQGVAGSRVGFKRQQLAVDAETAYAVGRAILQRPLQGRRVVPADAGQLFGAPSG